MWSGPAETVSFKGTIPTLKWSFDFFTVFNETL